MHDDKIYALFGVGAVFTGVDAVIGNVEPVLRVMFLILQIVIAAFTAALLFKKLRIALRAKKRKQK